VTANKKPRHLRTGVSRLEPGDFDHGWSYAAEHMDVRERLPTLKISSAPSSKRNPASKTDGVSCLEPGDDLLSHEETSHYHWR
jgi:hypothetical protein